jgi:hypothetical protein
LLTHFPSLITAGLSLKTEVVLDDYPAPTWSLRAILRGPAQIDLVSAAAGTGHLLSAGAAATANWTAGLYALSLRAASGDDVFEVEAGQVSVLADLVGVANGHDARGHAQRTLSAIEAVLEGRASKDQQSYTINGRSLLRTTIADLLLLRSTYRKEVQAERAGGRGRRLVGRQVRVRFAK